MVTKILDKLRYVVIIAVVFSCIGSFLMFFVGAKKVYKAVDNYFFVQAPKTISTDSVVINIEHLSKEDIATAEIIESLDSFIIGMVMLFFAFGMYALLIIGHDKALERGMPEWIVPKDLGKLKETLAQTIIVILFILFARLVWLNLWDMTWELLILPIAIALLAVALKLVDFK